MKRRSVGFHTVKPGLRLSSGKLEETSTSWKSSQRLARLGRFEGKDKPELDLRAAATTASFSTGFKEQVEYTILPSSFRRFIAR